MEERVAKTAEALADETSVLYQGVLTATIEIAGEDCEILGIPDFLIPAEAGGHVIRDSKMARRINEKDHPEIQLQLGIYGWLYAQVTSREPPGLEVHSGTGDIVEVSYIGTDQVPDLFNEIAQFKAADTEPYSPVGWSKCDGCCFQQCCWPRAEEARSAALVPSVDQGLAIALRDEGVWSIDDLLANFDEEHLADFQRPWGRGLRRVGTAAAQLLREARALATGREIVIAPPEIPEFDNYVMFDLEGLPPQLDELDKVYLWGLRVFGERPSEFMAAVTGFDDDGDRQGWEDFLAKAASIFDSYGDLPFVHWHHYERVKIDMYVERFGDPDGVAARIKDNLLDLLPITKRSVALPLPSYSLKVVEGYVGFARTQDEYGGDWAMARYIEAVESEDDDQRQQVMADIIEYNREDLEATWAALQWLRSKRD